MRLIKIMFAVTLMLFAATGFAAKPDKTTICHVGSEVGPNGEDYLSDPGCQPGDDNDYFCPDAGKIDLIEVAKAGSHLGDTRHTGHMYDEIWDYEPLEIGASGVGNEDTDGDGVDEGCEPPPDTLACPCWEGLTHMDLLDALSELPLPDCGSSLLTGWEEGDDDPGRADIRFTGPAAAIYGTVGGGSNPGHCEVFDLPGIVNAFHSGIPHGLAAMCYYEVEQLWNEAGVCPP